MKNLGKLTYAIITVFLTAFLCSYFNDFGMQNFYYSLQFPPFVPQSEVFPVVWSMLYALMIVSFFIISLNADKQSFKRCNMWYLGQLVLHILWTYSFFVIGAMGAGVIILLLLCFNVYKMISCFSHVDEVAAYLQYPYMAWVLFATYLNIGFVYYNGAFAF